MKILHISALSVLLLGAAALTTPVMAADSTPSAPAAALNAQDTSANTNKANASAPGSANTQVAMNSSAAENSTSADLSAIPDNSHKFSQSRLSAENASEDQTTKDLNLQESKATSSMSSTQ